MPCPARLAAALIVAAHVAAAPPASAQAAAQPAQRIEVRVDPRIELLSIIFRLAGAEEFTSPYPAYSAAIDTFFAPFRNHPITAAVRKLREQRGISHDAVMSLAVHLTDVPGLKDRTPFDKSQLEARWKPDEARAFAELVRSFAKESRAERFFSAQQPLYDLAARRMSALIEQYVDQPWFPKFFGPSVNARFILVVALDNGQVAYGTRFYPSRGPREIYAVMNAIGLDDQKLPTFGPSLVPTIVHEFSHSFVNPMVDAHVAEIRTASDTVYGAVAKGMRGQGYGEPRTMVSESIVRAAVARYVYDHKGIDSALAELANQRVRSFFWIDDLFALLGAYQGARDRHATIESFWPVLAGYYRDLAPRMNGVMGQAEQRRPTIVQIVPSSGSENVDPSLTSISITFDRPMRDSYATMIVDSVGRDHFPTTSALRWDASKRVLTMTVALKPAWSYEFGLNSESVSGFASQEGYALKPVRVRFTTAPAKSP